MEYEEIISQKVSTYFAEIIIKTLINKQNLIRVSPTWRFELIENDPDDTKFVDCAVCAQAEFLVSNDHHFNILKDIDFPPINVIKLQDFIKEIR